jgi:hypothetical protein
MQLHLIMSKLPEFVKKIHQTTKSFSIKTIKELKVTVSFQEHSMDVTIFFAMIRDFCCVQWCSPIKYVSGEIATIYFSANNMKDGTKLHSIFLIPQAFSCGHHSYAFYGSSNFRVHKQKATSGTQIHATSKACHPKQETCKLSLTILYFIMWLAHAVSSIIFVKLCIDGVLLLGALLRRV